MTFSYKLSLFLLGALFLVGFLCSKECFAMEGDMQKKDEEISKKGIPTKDPSREDDVTLPKKSFLDKIKSLPKGSLESREGKLSPSVRNREDRYWKDQKGNPVLLESK
ncbi:MAG: hypothetical protein BGO67_08760 [Alphaproteobacteria bacterium 41-28]|nr:MAG: hypothetical protein BGO67_08760 [Alphaproteobacteria bacterium 41-28]